LQYDKLRGFDENVKMGDIWGGGYLGTPYILGISGDRGYLGISGDTIHISKITGTVDLLKKPSKAVQRILYLGIYLGTPYILDISGDTIHIYLLQL